jgi:thiamine biosynthesis lipoprotein
MKLFEFQFYAMTTPCKVKLYTDCAEKANDCFLKIKHNTLLLEKKYNFYDEKSYLSREINSRKRNKVSIDNQTFEILKQIRQLSIDTNGVFDITVGTLKECYKLDTVAKVQSCLKKKTPYTGLNSYFLKDKKLHFKDKTTLIDLGGVIKEYAVDEAIKIAKNRNIQTALINFGGDIYGYGLKPDNNPFSIAIKNPANPEENIAIIPLENQALTTSANYERYVEIEGKSFSHIIGDMSNDIISSTIISDSVLKSGVYSTVFMLDTHTDIPTDMGVLLIDKEMRIHQNLIS